VIGRRVACRVVVLIVEEWPVARAKRGADVVVAGREAIDPISARVVRLIASAGGVQPALPLDHLVAQHLYARVGDRIAELVEDAPRDGGASRQREIGAFHQLAIGNLDRRAGLERALLSEAQRHVARLRRGQVPASRGKILELETPLRIGADEAIGAQLARLCAHLRAAYGRSAVGGDDASADDRGSRGLIAGAVAAGLIARGQLRTAGAATLTECSTL